MAETGTESKSVSQTMKPSPSGSWFPSFLTTTSKPGPTLPTEEDEIALVSAAEEGGVAIATSGNATAATVTAVTATTAATTAKEEALKKKEQELAERERRLKEQETQAASSTSRAPNFPWIWPVMYHNIAIDIPKRHQRKMTWIYRSWMFLGLCLVINCVSCLVVLLAHPQGMSPARDFGVSCTYWVGIMWASFYLWYRPVYNAFMKESSLWFNFYFFFGGWHVLFDFYMFLGIPGSGSAGVIYAMALLTDDPSKQASGILCGFTAALWLLSGIWSLSLYKVVHSHYRSQGLTAEEAQQEAIKGVAKTGVFQSLAKTAVMG